MSVAPKVSLIIPAYNAEAFIRETLDSIRKQTLSDFECVIINDGSKDNTASVIETAISGDARFRLISQSNAGVGAARNKGLDEAKGKYIAFCDADDILPEDSLEVRLLTAEKYDADLVIANMEFNEPGGGGTIKALDRLTEKADINPFDEDLIMTGSPCNKLFRRKLIEDNKLRFHNIARAEDFLFCLMSFGLCERICGCNKVVYHYERRAFWEDSSLTQQQNMSILNDVFESQDRCIEAINANYERHRNRLNAEDAVGLEALETSFRRMRSALYLRFVRTNFLNEIYRYIWTTDAALIDAARERYDQFKAKIYPDMWKREVEGVEKDLLLVDGRMATKEEMAANPDITFALADIKDKEKLNLTVRGIYSQNFPSFEVITNRETFNLLNDDVKGMENLRVEDEAGSGIDFKRYVLNNSKGNFIWYIDAPVYLARSSVRKAYNRIFNKPEFLFVSTPFKGLKDGRIDILKSNNTAFINKYAVQMKRTAFNQLDNVWENKLFSKSRLLADPKPFRENSWKTLNRFYMRFRYLTVNNAYLITDRTDADFVRNVRNLMVKLRWRHEYKQEENFNALLEKRTQRQVTLAEKIDRVKTRNKKLGLRWVTVKIIYPFFYSIYRQKKVNPRKVLFVEPLHLKPTNSVELVMKQLKERNKYDINFISLARNKVRKREEVKRNLKFLKEFATAKYVFTTADVAAIGGLTKRKETTFIQLWHACGAFKKFGMSTAELMFGGDREEKLKYPDYSNLDLISVSSEDVVWAYEEAMCYEGKGVVKALGTSRTDVFYDAEFVEASRRRVHELIPESADKKVIIYAPTFRGRLRFAKGPDKLDIAAMKERLGDEYVLLIKHHPLVKKLPEIPAEGKGFAWDVSHSLTIDDLLCTADICISDYSSLIFEYSLFEKPMVFFAYDLDEYNDWRGFYYNYDELTPGPVEMTTEGVINYIENVDTDFDRDRVIRFKDKFMSACDGHATERIIEWMEAH